MTELSITRGRDIGLLIDGTPLCGVTHFKAVTRYQRHELKEYLSSQPYDTIPESESHEIVLTVLSLFGRILYDRDSFTLCVADGDTEYRYEDCSVAEIERDVNGDKAVADRYTIKAAKMTKRGRENAR